MLKRRHIREIAVQFLYFADHRGESGNAGIQEKFWQLVQEKNLKKHSRTKAKAMLHLAQGWEKRLEKLAYRVAKAGAEIQAAGDTVPLLTALGNIIRQEEQLGTTIEAVRETLKNKPDQSLDPILEKALNISHGLDALRGDWLSSLGDLPSWRGKLEPVAGTIRQMQRISDHLRALDAPPRDKAGFSHLYRTHAAITILRDETQLLVQNIIRHKQDIDSALASVIQNFSPERVDPVDRAILRLATYEILYNPDIPRAVSINEAIELAKKFGTTESARFINGVLDAINK